MDKFVGDQLLALSKYSREQKGRRTYLLRCKKVGSVGKVGWEVILGADLEFVKKSTRPNFCAKEFYTMKTRKSRLFSPAINSENASLSEIWPSFG